MNILYITARLPYPVIGGDKVRAYNMMLQLKKLGHKITLVCSYDENDNLEEALKHNEFYDEIYPIKFNTKLAYLKTPLALLTGFPFIVQYFYSTDMQKQIDKLIATKHFDLLTGYMPRIAPYYEKHKNKNVLLDMCDAFSMMYKRRIEVNRSWFDKFKISFEYRRMKRLEQKCLKSFKLQTVISKFDKEYLESISKKSNLHIVGNGVDTDYFKPIEAKKENNICFVGSLRYIANHEAVMYFATKVFPLIRKEIPDAKFKIIGAYPKPVLYEIAKQIDGIEITGRVDDVRDYMKDCKVSVCPVKIAGGVQNKILESMAMGIPTVTTKEGAEGIFAPEYILPVVNTDEEYAKKVIDVLSNPILADEMSIKSREFIIDNFSWSSVGKQLEKVIAEDING